MQCCLEPLGQHCTKFLPVQCCPKSIRTTLNRIFFLCNVVWSLLDNIAQSLYLRNVVPRVLRQHWTGFFPMQCCPKTGFSLVQCCPKSIKTTLNKIFSSAMLCGASWTILHKSFYLCNVVPRVLRQHWTGIFPLQCCLEPLGQHSTKFLPVKCCPKSVKTTLKVIFSCPTFSEASLTKLHKVFTCAMLSQEF